MAITRRKTVLEGDGHFHIVLGNGSDPSFKHGVECPLFDVVTALQYAAMIHQYNHWFAEGPAFRALHELFAQAYDACQKHADAVAERALMRNEPLDISYRLAAMVQKDAGRNQACTIKHSIDSEQCIIDCCEAAISSLENQPRTQGIINLLQGILDEHDGLLYFLTQTAQ